jgi:ornithine carbamoyltransferase
VNALCLLRIGGPGHEAELTAVKDRIVAMDSLGAVMKSALHPVVPHFGLRPCDGLAPAELPDIFKAACRLKAASLAGRGGRPLLGKNLALLHSTPPDGEISVLHKAALELGARVANVRLSEPLMPAESEFRYISQVLGRLYDAVDCTSLPPAIAQQIERHAGVPVYSGLERDEHPAKALADLMTLFEHGCEPGPKTRIFFLGDPCSPRGSAIAQAAGLLGFDLQSVAAARPASNDAVFSVDARKAAQWVLHAPSGPIDDAERSVNHRFVLQAVLLGTMLMG